MSYIFLLIGFYMLIKGADAFVGGDIPYHVAQEAVERGMSVIDCGHYGSEKASAKIFRELLFALTSDWDIVAFEEELGGEIIKRYYYHRGYYAYMIRYDKQLDRALEEITKL